MKKKNKKSKRKNKRLTFAPIFKRPQRFMYLYLMTIYIQINHLFILRK